MLIILPPPYKPVVTHGKIPHKTLSVLLLVIVRIVNALQERLAVVHLIGKRAE